MLQIGFIKRVNYLKWLANVVVVPKNINECMRQLLRSQQSLLEGQLFLPKIDQLVDTTMGHQLLSFIDAFFCQNLIMIYEPYKEVTFFVTDQGLFCNKVVLFCNKVVLLDLRNAGATYQRLVLGMFK